MDKGQTASDFGFAVSLFEFGADFTLVYFNMYEDCDVEALMQSVGQITNLAAIAGNFLITVALAIYDYLVDENPDSVFARIDAECAKKKVKEEQTEEEWFKEHYEAIGIYCGNAMSTMFNFIIPIFKVNEYGVEG